MSALMKKRPLNVLIACEESQTECKAFRALGHNAFSCDIQRCSRHGHPEWHICGDVSPFLAGRTAFYVMTGERHNVGHWDLIIAHPPCTYLCKLSSVQLRKNADCWRFTATGWQGVNCDRFEKMQAARAFFLTCLNACAPYVAVENPLPMRMANLPPATCYAAPSWFGVKYTKKTLYWLRNLPPIIGGQQHPTPKSFVNCSRGKYRSRTFPQLADALARQWSAYILDDMERRCE